MAQRRLARPARIVLWSLAAVVGVVVLAGIVLALSFDPDSLKPRIVAAVKQATGRDLTLQGRIRLGLSLQPTLVAQGVSLANPPGFSRPQFLTLDELDLKLALLPLLSHRVEIDRLVLVKPDILLETNAQGQSNWHFTPEANKAVAEQPAASAADEKVPTRISLAEVRIDNGTLAWRDDRTARNVVLGIASLRAEAPSADANMHREGDGDLQRSAVHAGWGTWTADASSGCRGGRAMAGEDANRGGRQQADCRWHHCATAAWSRLYDEGCGGNSGPVSAVGFPAGPTFAGAARGRSVCADRRYRRIVADHFRPRIARRTVRPGRHGCRIEVGQAGRCGGGAGSAGEDCRTGQLRWFTDHAERYDWRAIGAAAGRKAQWEAKRTDAPGYQHAGARLDTEGKGKRRHPRRWASVGASRS